MDRKVFEERIDHVLQTAIKDAKTKALALFDSGRIDANEVDDQMLPRVILYVVLQELSDIYAPVEERHREIAEALQNI